MAAETLGSGSFAIVEKVLIKNTYVARKTNYARKEAKHDLEREYAILASLNHPNIIKPLGLTEGKNGFYMPLYAEDLEHTLGHNLFQPQQISHILSQTASALAYLHSQGYVHCDLKPANILLDSSRSEAVLCDFGFTAKQTDSDLVKTLMGLASYKHPTGTLLWLPPERLNSPQVTVAASDIYSFALVAYALYQDEEPWADYEDPDEFLEDFHNEALIPQLQQPRSCPLLVWHLLLSAWQSKFKRRPSAREFVVLFDAELTQN